MFLLLGLRELWRDHPERAAIFAVIAALIKPQLAILVPIVAAVTIRRALWPEDPERGRGRGAAAADASLRQRLLAWERRTGHPIRILTTGLAGLVMTLILSAPVGLSVLEIGPNGLRSGLLEQIFSTASGYPYVSVNAYNPWALAEVERQRHRRERQLDLRRGDRQPGGRRPGLRRGVPDLRGDPGRGARGGPARLRVRRRLRHRRASGPIG